MRRAGQLLPNKCQATQQPAKICRRLLLLFAVQELELALNEITPDGARAVAACVAAKPALRRLNLRENELEDEGAVIVAKVGG